VGELLACAPGIPWRRFFDSAGAAGADRVIVAENTAVRGLAQLFASTPLETLQAWQIFRTVDGASA
jgi:putative endopeptidase